MSFWEELDTLVKVGSLVIDRPKGTAHPRYPDFIYPADYGYLEGTCSPDGHEVDIWIGTAQDKPIDAILCTVDPIKKDVEVKILYQCTEAEKRTILEIQNKVMKAILVRRPE